LKKIKAKTAHVVQMVRSLPRRWKYVFLCVANLL